MTGYGSQYLQQINWNPEGGRKATLVKSPGSVEIGDGKRTRVVHTNRLQHRIQAAADGWIPPQVEHFIKQRQLHQHIATPLTIDNHTGLKLEDKLAVTEKAD